MKYALYVDSLVVEDIAHTQEASPTNSEFIHLRGCYTCRFGQAPNILRCLAICWPKHIIQQLAYKLHQLQSFIITHCTMLRTPANTVHLKACHQWSQPRSPAALPPSRNASVHRRMTCPQTYHAQSSSNQAINAKEQNLAERRNSLIFSGIGSPL